jgi:4-amino-4-deoxy-L-arabinose transferase-like glycosyltransferase
MKSPAAVFRVKGTTGFLLVCILLLALALRLWAIKWGLPYLYHHDETDFVPIFQHIFKTGDLNPHAFDYGSVFFYINAISYIPYYLAGLAAGTMHSPNDIAYPSMLVMGDGITAMPSTYVLGRSVTTVFGVASVFMVFLIGRRVSGKPMVGLIAAVMMAISPTCVALSREISPNMFLVFFILLTVWGAIKIYEENTTAAFLLSGVAAGLVVGTKYNGGLVFGVVVLACLLRSGWAALKDRRLYAAAAISAATFLLTTPFAVLDYPSFIRDFTNQASHYATGHLGMEGDTVQWYTNFLWTQEGPVAVLGWIGAIYALVRRSRPLIIVASFPIGYGIFISSFIVRNDRTILPLLPFLYILAAVVIVDTARWVMARDIERRAALATSALVLVLLAIVPFNMSSAAAIQANAPDSRLTGVQWIGQNIPPGSKVGIEVGAPYLDPQTYSVQPVDSIIAHPPQWYVDQHYDYLIFADGMFGRFFREPDRYAGEVAQYEAFFSTFQLVKDLDDGGYQVKVYKVTSNE